MINRKGITMKKLLCALIMLTVVVTTSCGNYIGESDSENKSNMEEVNYVFVEPFCHVYRDVHELIEGVEPSRKDIEILIFTGNVTGISFQILDITTGGAPTHETEKKNCYLNTIYEIDIITSYKGKYSEKTQIRMLGGIIDYRTEEQLSISKEIEDFNGRITIVEGMPEINIGETYLFVTGQFLTIAGQFVTSAPTLVNLNQSVYNLHNPFDKKLEGYSDNIFPISAKDIISAFGEDKWDSFWTQWQKDNPKWETWLDRSEVDKALAQN